MHVDADSFFASVETRQKPSLARTPVLVGGTGPRGVVATANYEARAFGCHSAMPMAQARVLCPSATVLTPRFPAYAAHSALIMDTLRQLSPLVAAGQPRRGVRRPGRRPVRERPGRGCGPGAPADLQPVRAGRLRRRGALEARSPSSPRTRRSRTGSPSCHPRCEDEFLLPKPVSALPGVGPATDATLRRLGIVTVADLRATSRDDLIRTLGEAAGLELVPACSRR